MSVAVLPQSALRLERADASRLVLALVISLAMHLLIWGTWYGGDKLGVYDITNRSDIFGWRHEMGQFSQNTLSSQTGNILNHLKIDGLVTYDNGSACSIGMRATMR